MTRIENNTVPVKLLVLMIEYELRNGCDKNLVASKVILNH